jgi:prepilin-type N-terminal cleavage/methylation domain-containing protein/prepilin-type processing-associated H-X9-DG protein
MSHAFPPRHASRVSRAFTLIELLTVIAIIGVLAAILIPTVSKVRQSARNAQCVSHLREWGRIILLYSNDNKGNYYTLNWGSVAPGDAPLGRSYQPYYNTSKWEGFRMRYCPADPETPTLMLNSGGENPRYAMVYGSVGTLGNRPSEAKTRPAALPLSRATRPSQYLLMLDSFASGTVGANVRLTGDNAGDLNTYIIPLTNGSSTAVQRHGGRYINGLFGDGSVKRITYAGSSPSDTTSIQVMRNTWFVLY